MPSHLESLLEQSADDSRFHATSRYHGAPILSATDAAGREVRYAARRFIPEVDTADDLAHVVSAGERPDHLARQYLEDPERFWELCDHNLSLRPWTLTELPGDFVLVPADTAEAGGSGAAFFSM